MSFDDLLEFLSFGNFLVFILTNFGTVNITSYNCIFSAIGFYNEALKYDADDGVDCIMLCEIEDKSIKIIASEDFADESE